MSVVKRQVEVMGTIVSFDVRGGQARPDEVYVALARSAAVLRRADFVFSTWKPESPVSRLRRGEISVEQAPPEVADVLALCALARDASGGWFDPWAASDGVDPTGLVKGWAAERALAELVGVPGLEGAMVNAGGDIASWGRPAPDREWRFGLRSPGHAATLVAVVEGVAAVATSGTYERGPHLYSPRLHPSTGGAAGIAPVTSAAASATVLGPGLWMADALATALAVAGVAGLPTIEMVEGYEALVVDMHGEVTTTTHCPAEVLPPVAA
ncbi:MAG TPA: FAD:protein FMN transferase [Acidimicrobiales bacterium]|nr:FAD:protein FMN transferase [Acidimicrobiales bacterium]